MVIGIYATTTSVEIKWSCRCVYAYDHTVYYMPLCLKKWSCRINALRNLVTVWISSAIPDLLLI